LGYIDLYLIHGPIGGPEARRESWRAICDAQKEGTLKSIGISTFGVRHMEEIVDLGLPLPVINQVGCRILPLAPPLSISSRLTCTPSWFEKMWFSSVDLMAYSLRYVAALTELTLFEPTLSRHGRPSFGAFGSNTLLSQQLPINIKSNRHKFCCDIRYKRYFIHYTN
jgi:hypothetical protein